ncbi:MAG: SPFH domain-containing protein [Polyangiaceae bacterium]
MSTPETNRLPDPNTWRGARPIEDPEKTKRWGFVTAKPSEYLVHVRRGRVLGTSGQGASCFKWPWDAVAIVPTSLQRLAFRADQVTLEKVGVEVVGLAVYRIADPLIAYRVLNFSFPERAQQKLEETLTQMFVGATRRLVANLPVEDCLKKRKSALAAELLREVAPVVGGEGTPDDTTDKGWGVVIDTIEIQEVRVLSAGVFASMQAPFRSELERAARQARADAERDIALRDEDCRKSIEEAKIRTTLAVQAERSSLERAEAEARLERALRDETTRRDVERARLDASAEVEAHALRLQEQTREQQAEAEAHTRRRLQRAKQIELETHEALLLAARAQAELAALELDANVAKRERELVVVGNEGRLRAELALLDAQAEREAAEAHARRSTADHLPALAAAMSQRFENVNLTHIGGDPSAAFGSIAHAIRGVLDIVNSSSSKQSAP